jgi:hypothetical protein
MNLRTQAWHAPFLDMFHITPDMLPRIVSNAEVGSCPAAALQQSAPHGRAGAGPVFLPACLSYTPACTLNGMHVPACRTRGVGTLRAGVVCLEHWLFCRFTPRTRLPCCRCTAT